MRNAADPQTELAALGCVVINPESLHDLAAVLGPTGECFHDARNAAVWEAMNRLQARGVKPDIVTILAEVGDRVKGADPIFLSSLMDATPTSAGAAEYARLVRASHTRRRLIAAGREIMVMAEDSSETVETVLDQLNRTYADLSERHTGGDAVSIGTCVADALENLEHLAAGGGALCGIPAGMPDLDGFTGGWKAGDLIIVAARPSVGKTAFALNAAHHAAKAGTPVYFFSLEMDRTALAQRLLCMAGNARMDRMKSGFRAEEAVSAIKAAAPVIAGLPFYVDDSPRATLWELQSKARRLQRKHGRGLVVVDYLQLLTTGKKSEARYIEVGEISRGLKALARELKTPVIALCQFGRSAEKETDDTRVLAHLRESGSIEQDADLVIALLRLSKEQIAALEKEHGKGGALYQNVLPCVVAKHRNGPTGKVQLYFNRETQVIGPLANAKPPEHMPPYDGPDDCGEDDSVELF